jgi:predicted glutamine amidotransferase
MCRLLGIVASRRAALAQLLDEDLERFLELACLHKDGWGLAYTDATDDLALIKETLPADSSDRFRSVVDCCVTDAALLHLRLASPGLAVKEGNTHPFGDRLFAFAHNGAFSPVDVLDEEIGAQRLATALGDTDSERFSLAVRRRLDEGADPAEALIETAAQIRKRAATWMSLNCLLLTRDALYAYGDHDPASEVLERRGPDFFDLRYRVTDGRVVVGSTGWTLPGSDWIALPRRSVLRIRRFDLSVEVIEG